MAELPGADSPLAFIENTAALTQYPGGSDHKPGLFARWGMALSRIAGTLLAQDDAREAVLARESAELSLAAAERTRRLAAAEAVQDKRVSASRAALAAADQAVEAAVAARDTAREQLARDRQHAEKLLDLVGRQANGEFRSARDAIAGEALDDRAAIDRQAGQALKSELFDAARYTSKVVVHSLTGLAAGVLTMAASQIGPVGETRAERTARASARPPALHARTPDA